MTVRMGMSQAVVLSCLLNPKTGKLKLSHKALLPKPEGYEEPEKRERRDRGERSEKRDGKHERREHKK